LAECEQLPHETRQALFCEKKISIFAHNGSGEAGAAPSRHGVRPSLLRSIPAE
jgi:hypothetical protein